MVHDGAKDASASTPDDGSLRGSAKVSGKTRVACAAMAQEQTIHLERYSPDAKALVAGAQQLARANAVVEYMVTTGGIDRSRFDAIGAGDQNPVGDNTTAEGRALNRRIDVKLVNLLG